MAERIATRGIGMAPGRDAVDNRQSRRMLAALIVLLVALAVTVLRDRDDLFGSDTPSDQAQPVAAATVSNAPVAEAVTPAPVETPAVSSAPAPVASVPAKHVPAPASKSRPVRSIQAQVIHHENPANSVVTNAAQRAQLSAAAPVQATAANYPLLDASTRVQGSVVLQALIGADGAIQDLRVVTGPAILGSAARQAVLGWRFKPFMENGRAVETQATITVNFTIKVADSGNKTARSYTPDKVIVLADNT